MVYTPGMKTTLELDDALDARLRKTAHRRGWTLKETVSRALRAGLLSVAKETAPAPMNLTMAKGPLLIDPCDKEALSEAIPPEL